MTITISHRGIIIAECKTTLEAWEQKQKWQCVFKPLEVKVKR